MAAADDYDLAIIGGGMVGATLASALAGRGWRIAVIEAVAPQAPRQPSYDDRVIALAYGTRRIFQGMGLWSELEPQVTPIREIHVSDRGRFGAVRMRAADEGVEALGYVAESRVLGRVLGARLDSLSGVDLFRPATVTGLDPGTDRVRVELEAQGERRSLHARLAVAADGSGSGVRHKLGIPVSEWAYGQTAIIANVTPSRPHAHIAFERFTSSGPLALLPMSEGRCAVVWTVADDDLEGVMELSDAHFLAALQERFGRRLGTFARVGGRAAYPLRLVRALEHVRPRLALIGNAAHTLHPVAGQGYNLGIRDVAVLADVLARAHAAGEDPGHPAVLKRYGSWRARDHLKAIALTDGLARVFSNPLAPVAFARDAGLVAVDLCPPLKRMLTRQTMGLAGRLPRLARGLPS